MKKYEAMACPDRLMPLLPVIARLDGRSFHSLTRGLEKPFDERFISLMQETAKYLIEETNAPIAYVQSDEISLLWHEPEYKSQIFFDGRIQKMVSTLAAMASVKFNQLLPKFLPEKARKSPTFDCRVFTVPNKEEVHNAFLWRIEDAERNSIQAVGQVNFSHKQMQGLNNRQVLEKLKEEKNFDWESFPEHLRYGTMFRKETEERQFTTEEIDKLPAKHEARSNPELTVQRSVIRRVNDLKYFKSCYNWSFVLFCQQAIDKR